VPSLTCLIHIAKACDTQTRFSSCDLDHGPMTLIYPVDLYHQIWIKLSRSRLLKS